MDFENYTLGRLVTGRGNYDFKHAEYSEVRRQVVFRIVQLGYSWERFDKADRMIAEGGVMKAEATQKLIAMARSTHGLLTSKCTDSSLIVEDWATMIAIGLLMPTLIRAFLTNRKASSRQRQPTYLSAHLQSHDAGSQKDQVQTTVFYSILKRSTDTRSWVLLQGYLEESASVDDRRVFTFFRGILLDREKTSEVVTTFNAIDYPGNSAIPEPLKDYYTYAGEIPWSKNFARYLREADGTAKKNEDAIFAVYDGARWLPGIPVEPVHEWVWESYHSDLNQVGNATVLAPGLCECFRTYQPPW